METMVDHFVVFADVVLVGVVLVERVHSSPTLNQHCFVFAVGVVLFLRHAL